MTTAQFCIIAAIIIYLILMIYVGFYFSRQGSGSSSHEFYLGGRKLGPIVTAMSAEASDMSSWLLMGLPGLAYLSGIAEPGWTAIGLAVGTYLNWLIVAKRLRCYSVRTGAITIPDFFSRRYRDDRHVLSLSLIHILDTKKGPIFHSAPGIHDLVRKAAPFGLCVCVSWCLA